MVADDGLEGEFEVAKGRGGVDHLIVGDEMWETDFEGNVDVGTPFVCSAVGRHEVAFETDA